MIECLLCPVTKTWYFYFLISDFFCNDIVNHTSLCEFYQGKLLLHFAIAFEEKPKSNLPGDNLRYYRLRKSLTTRQLAEQIGVVPATILMYGQNKHPIPYDVANNLAAILNVNADVLYDDFASFLAVPYNEALKGDSFGCRNVSEGICRAYRSYPKLLL